MCKQEKMGSFLLGMALCGWLFSVSPACGQGRGGGRQGSGGKGTPADKFNETKPPPPLVMLTPHGGEYITTEANHYEVVYMPLQTRIYLFDDKLEPLSAQNVHVQMALHVSREKTSAPIAFQYVAPPAGAGEQDYVMAVFDMRGQDKETPITFEFSALPDRQHPTLAFTPLFSPAKIRPYVSKVLLTKADREGVFRQRTCPVCGAVLGSQGPIVKIYIAEYPLYLSGDDCLTAVKENPEKFLPQLAPPGPGR